MEIPVDTATSALSLWKQLYDSTPTDEKVTAAAALLASSDSKSKDAVWLFQWFTGAGAGGLISKKSSLSLDGTVLLCDLIESLPPSYPLGSCAPLLITQMKLVLTDLSGVCGVAGLKDAMRPAVMAGAAAPLRDFVRAHQRLVTLLLHRPALSFRPTKDQASSLFIMATDVLGKLSAPAAAEDASRLAEADEYLELLDLITALGKFMLRALEFIAPKKAYRAVVELMPSLASLCSACAVETQQHAGKWTAYVHSVDPHPQKAKKKKKKVSCKWQQEEELVRVICLLLHHCVAPEHMDSYENLVRSAKEPPRASAKEAGLASKRKRDGKRQQQQQEGDHGDAYQLGLFQSLEGLISKPEMAVGCVALLPLLLEGFIAEYRDAVADRGLAAAVAHISVSEHSSEKNQSPMPVPCEFWFFMHLSEVLQPSLALEPKKRSTDVNQRLSLTLVSCLVDLWRRVRIHGTYRPREDPKHWQIECLEAFCAIMVRRLSRAASAGLDVRQNPEWDGLIQVLQLDVSPFEDQLEQVWSLLADACAQEVPSSIAASSKPTSQQEGSAYMSFAVALLQTYARLADLAGCVDALIAALRAGPPDRADRLVSQTMIRQSLQRASKDVSIEAAAAQSKKVWASLLEEIRQSLKQQREKPQEAQNADPEAPPRKKRKKQQRQEEQHLPSATSMSEAPSWPAVLLEEVVRGLRVSELSVEMLRDLALQTFTLLEEVSQKLPQHDQQNLLLALCICSRRVTAWDLPPSLKTPEGAAAVLANKVFEGLSLLTQPLLVVHKRKQRQGSDEHKPRPVLPCHADAAMQFVALQQAGLGQVGIGANDPPPAEPVASVEVVSAVLKLAKRQMAVEQTSDMEGHQIQWKDILLRHHVLLRRHASDEGSSILDNLLHKVDHKASNEEGDAYANGASAGSLEIADAANSRSKPRKDLSSTKPPNNEAMILSLVSQLSVAPEISSSHSRSEADGKDDSRESAGSAVAALSSLLQMLRALPSRRQVLSKRVTDAIVLAVQGLLAHTVTPLRRAGSPEHLEHSVATLLAASEVVQALFNHLSAPLQSRKTATKRAHLNVANVEALVLHLASQTAEVALHMQPQASLEFSEKGLARTRLQPQQFGALLAATHSLMSALFSAVRCDGARLPAWVRKPHVIVGILKQLLEGVYQAWDGAQAVRLASQVTRLWEAYTLGGSRLVPRAAQKRRRARQVSFQAQVQKATRGFVIVLLGHALEQQRRWVGMDAAVQRSLRSVPPEERVARRVQELAQWKEALSILQVGMNPLFQSLEGADHLKQCLYVSLREPLNNMFREAHESFRKRGKYRGEA